MGFFQEILRGRWDEETNGIWAGGYEEENEEDGRWTEELWL